MQNLTWPQVFAWRMRRQFLTVPEEHGDPVAVTRRLAGVQAQVASAAVQALAVRGAVLSGDVAENGLIRTWAMRGTLHLLPREDAPAYLALCATVRNWEKPSWTKAFGATPADLEAIAEAAREALDGVALTREELTEAVVARTGSEHLRQALGSGWGPLLKPLAWWGVLRHGPSRGGKATFTSPGFGEFPAPEEAARVVLRAYLGAHGPATPPMFDNWLMRRASRKSDVKRWFAALDGELSAVSVEGEEMYALTCELDALLDTAPSSAVRLLGPFDQYVLGAGTDAVHLIPPDRRSEVSRAAGWIAPVVLHRGRVAGTWDPQTAETSLWEEVPADLLARELERWKHLA
ncbi:DNA glycosylase AlkZ-like family protein [Actinocorallia populi]|uniref:DNA glycosylase AlkZ-like family protein n=1 Tax=Actinocorallia populi TaxID=2079200 RepID=UPI000D093599|nr:crosslink repair DNA glycosylase YcaQ family protein [Actinocorallia populi]